MKPSRAAGRRTKPAGCDGAADPRPRKTKPTALWAIRRHRSLHRPTNEATGATGAARRTAAQNEAIRVRRVLRGALRGKTKPPGRDGCSRGAAAQNEANGGLGKEVRSLGAYGLTNEA